MLEADIARDADGKRSDDDGEGNEEMAPHAPQELGTTDRLLLDGFVEHCAIMGSDPGVRPRGQTPSNYVNCRALRGLSEMRLLLVEDDSMIGTAAQQGLRGEGHTVDWARDGREADAAVRGAEYDL